MHHAELDSRHARHAVNPRFSMQHERATGNLQANHPWSNWPAPATSTVERHRPDGWDTARTSLPGARRMPDSIDFKSSSLLSVGLRVLETGHEDAARPHLALQQ